MSKNFIYNSLPMATYPPEALDGLLAMGYRLLGSSIIRHNNSETFGVHCKTIPLRINLDGFTFSKSQEKLLRKNQDLVVKTGPFDLTPEKVALFDFHTGRLKDRKVASTIYSFLTEKSGFLPTEGVETSVYLGDQLIAVSVAHQGTVGVSSTYCFFDPRQDKRSLGNYTMLLEIKNAIESNKKYYYLGYTHSVPCQFAYKLNFNNLEKLQWETLKWKSTPRVSPSNWLDYWNGLSEKPEGSLFGSKEG